MKKITLCLWMLSAIFFVGCDQQKQAEKQEAVAITLSETSVRMPILTYDEAKKEEVETTYSFTIQPEDTTYTVEASVAGIVAIRIEGSKVTLTANKMGKTILTITETRSGATAECAVEVFSVIEPIRFTQATVSYYYNEHKQNEYEVVDTFCSYTNKAGVEVPLSVYVVPATVSLFSEGFYITEDGLYAGTDIGYIIQIPATDYFAPSTLNADRGYSKDIIVSTGVWSTQQKGNYHKLIGGSLNKEEEALTHIRQAIDYSNQNNWEMYGEQMHIADSLAFQGAVIRKYVRSDAGYSKYTMPAAVVTEAVFSLPQGGNVSSSHMFLVSEAEMYIYPLAGYFGLGVDLAFDKEKKVWYVASKELEFGERIHYKYKL